VRLLSNPLEARALLIVWKRMCWEFNGSEPTDWRGKTAQKCADYVLESPERIEDARRYLTEHWIKLVDFFDRGLD
jgi:hypothetical protein